MSRYVLVGRAETDLDEIWCYIAQHDLPAADRMIDRLIERFEMLARQPGAGDLLGHVSPGLRCCPVGNYVVFYETDEFQICIKRVLHGARDLRKLLGGDE